MRTYCFALRGSAAALAVVVAAGASQAAEFPAQVFSITALRTDTNESYTWTRTLAPEDFVNETTYHWKLAADIELRDPNTNTLLGTLEGGASSATGVRYEADPVVALSFNVVAGAAPTIFLIASGPLGFAPIFPAIGRASAGMTATDLNGDGVTATGMFPGVKSYEAEFNGPPLVGTPFADLVGPLAAGFFSTDTDSEDFPAVGFAPIGPPVSSMSAVFWFTLSAFDSAAGTSVWVVIPTPGAGVLLLGAAGIMGLRRRRA